MPRRARITLPGIPMHVRHRGNNRQPCFFEEEDRSFYLFHLNRLLPLANCALHAYCLMTNHVHLLLTSRTADGCSQLMKHVAQLQTQYVNRTYGRSGSLWEGRFRSSLVQSEDYLLTCYRYVELNPVEAGLAGDPGDYAWSSYRANARGVRTTLVTPHDEYLRLGRDSNERRQAYRALFDVPLDPKRVDEIRAATNGNFALGSKAFRRAISAALGRRAEPGKSGRPSQRAGETCNQAELPGIPEKTVVCP
jgi:putative transposase